MASKQDLKYISAQTLIFEYKNCMAKIEHYKAVIKSANNDGNRSEAKRYKSPLALFETYKSQIEEEAARRNMPLDELTGLKE